MRVVLIRCFDGLPVPQSRVLLTWNFLWLKVSPSLNIRSCTSSVVRVRNAIFLSNSGLVRPINSCCSPV